MITARFVVLDGWRGICAMFVAMVHIDVLGHFFYWPIIRNGHFFVDFFFVLSGFVVTHAYGHRLTDARATGRYVVRRIGRLWPLHAAVLVAFVAAEFGLALLGRMGIQLSNKPLFSGPTSIEAIGTNLLLIQALGMHPWPTWNAPSWSISVELYVNILFGFMVPVLRSWLTIILNPAVEPIRRPAHTGILNSELHQTAGTGSRAGGRSCRPFRK